MKVVSSDAYSYPTWKITDPVEFMKTVKDVAGARARLTDIVSSELGVAFGQYDLSSLVTDEKGKMKLPEMMEKVTRISNDKVKEYGIAVTDVRVKVLNFPEKNKLSVFQRMRAERERIARKYRSEGTEEASKIRAQADKEKKVILSQAYEKAQILKGDGDALAIKIDADAFQKDPEFYKFLRSLEAYEKFIIDVINRAGGEAARFEKMLAEYEKNKEIYSADVTRYRLYLETMEMVMGRVKKYLVNTRNGEKVNLRILEGE